MAGIIANVDSDIQKLRALKNEIESVKKSLKGIDVNINVDIAQGLQERLQSLVDEYTKLGEKVSTTEAIINRSAEKILKTTEILTTAQEKMSQGAKNVSSQGMQNQKTESNQSSTDESESVKQQARAYDELKDRIDAVMGTRSQNVQRMIEEMNAIRLITAEINEINNVVSNGGELSDRQKNRLITLNSSLLEHKTALSDVRQELNNTARLDIAASTSMNEMSQALSRMRMAYRELSEDERSSPFGKELLSSIQQADTKIKELDASIGNNQRNVGNYKSGFNGLNMSVQQIVRELPSAKMGLSMFFLAISNNLPILADEIKRVKIANDALRASGESATPVWKQVLSSVFSWQTALMVGITMLTVYGKDIQNWFKNLVKVNQAEREAAENAAYAREEYKKYANSVASKASEQIVKYDQLRKSWVDLGKDQKAQKKFIDQNQEAFHNLGMSINTVNEANRALVSNSNKVVAALMAQSKAAAASELAKDYQEKLIKMDMKPIVYKKVSKTYGVYAGTNSVGGAVTFNASKSEKEIQEEQNAEIKKAKDQRARQRKVIVDQTNKLIKMSVDETNKYTSLYKSAGIREYSGDTKKVKKQKTNEQSITDAELKQKQDEAKTIKELQEKADKMEIEAKEEGYAKKLAELKYEHENELSQIESQKQELLNKKRSDAEAIWKANGKKGKFNDKVSLTPDENTQFTRMTVYANTKNNNAVKALNDEQIKSEKEALDKYYEAYGTYNEKIKALSEDYQRQITDAKTKGEKMKLKKEWDDALSQLTLDDLKKRIDWDVVFGDMTRVGKKHINSALLQLREFQSSSDYAGLLPQNKKVVTEGIVKLTNQQEELTSNPLTIITKAIESFKNASDKAKLEQKKADQNPVSDANKKVLDSWEKLKEAQMSGNKDAINAAQIQYDSSVTQLEAAKGQEDAAKKAKQSAEDTKKALYDSISKGADKLSKYTSDIKDAYDNFKSLGKINSNGGIEGYLNGQIQALGGISDTFKALKDSDVTGVIKGASEATVGIATSIANLGGIVHIFSSADYSDYNAMVSKYTKLIGVWNTLISRKKEYLNESYGSEVVKTEEEIEALYQKETAAYVEMGKARLRAGASTGSHSIGNRIGKQITSEDWSDISTALGMTISEAFNTIAKGGALQGLFDLSASQLEKLQEDAPLFWAKLDDSTREYLQNIIDAGDALDTSLDEAKTKLLGISLDSLMDKFQNFIDNLGSTWYDAADDFGEYLQKQILNSLVVSKYEQKIEDLYNSWWKKASSDGEITKDEYNEIYSGYSAIMQQAYADRDNLVNLFGWRSSGDSSSSSSATNVTASQDSVDEVNGRLTALEEIDIENKSISELSRVELNKISSYTFNLEGIADETRTYIINSYTEITGIHDDTKEMVKQMKNFSPRIENIEKSAKVLAGS